MAKATISAQAQELIDRAKANLAAKGYHPPLIDAAIARARGMADFHVRDLTPPLREQALLAILPKELHRAEEWIHQAEQGLTKGKGS